MGQKIQQSTVLHIGLIANSVTNILHYRESLIQMWESLGIRVTLLSPPFPEKFQLTQEWSSRSWICLDQLNPYSSNPWSLFKGLRQLREVFQKEAFDQVYTFTIKPNILAPLAAIGKQIEVIPTVTGLGYLGIRKVWKGWLTDLLYRMSFRRLSTVIFHNSDDLALFERKGIILPDRGRVIAGSGVDTKKYIPHIQDSNVPFTVLYLGRFLIDKGLRDLVSAFNILRQKIPAARLQMVGDHKSQNPSAISAKEIKIWSDMPGISCLNDVPDVRELIANSNVVVLPSLREGMPRAILEAMSMSRPVIVTDVPGCRQAVEHGVTGWIVPVGDVLILSQTLFECASMTLSESELMGKAGRERVIQYFSNEMVLAGYQDLIQPHERRS